LAKEKEHIPDRAYAQTSRFELAEWLTNGCYDENVNVFVGIEDGFSGATYIKKKIKDQYDYIGDVYTNLEDLLDAALKILK
jgi:hypothetical protein